MTTQQEYDILNIRRERIHNMAQDYLRLVQAKTGLLIMGEADDKVQEIEASIVRLLNELALELTGKPYKAELTNTDMDLTGLREAIDLLERVTNEFKEMSSQVLQFAGCVDPLNIALREEVERTLAKLKQQVNFNS